MQSFFETVCEACGYSPLNREKLSANDKVDLEISLGQFRHTAEGHALTRNPKVRVEIGFYDSAEINAFAVTYDNQDAVAISWGAMLALRGLFESVMRANNFLWIPASKRSEAASWFYDCAKYFLFLHELGHIWNGHTSLISETGRLCAIHETRASTGLQLSPIDRQTLEMDADAFAAANVYNFAAENTFPAVFSPIEERHGCGATSLAMASVAYYLFFKLFDEPADIDKHHHREHPSAPLRQFMIGGVLALRAAEMGLTEDNGWKVVVSGIRGAEDAFARFTGSEPDYKAIADAFSAEGYRYCQSLLRNWASLRPRLDVLKRGGNLPLVQNIPAVD